MLSVDVLWVVMLSVTFYLFYAECHYADCYDDKTSVSNWSYSSQQVFSYTYIWYHRYLKSHPDGEQVTLCEELFQLPLIPKAENLKPRLTPKAAKALVLSTAEHCSPIWTRKILSLQDGTWVKRYKFFVCNLQILNKLERLSLVSFISLVSCIK